MYWLLKKSGKKFQGGERRVGKKFPLVYVKMTVERQQK